MYSIGAFSQELLILYCVTIVGFIAKKMGVLNENANDVLTKLILNITLPALIIFSLDISFSIDLISEFLWLIFLSIYILTISCFLANWLKKRAKLEKNQQSVYEGLIIFGNQGFIGFALCYILFGQDGVVYLTIFNICYLILIWSYGIFIFTKNKATIDWKLIFLNPGIISTFIGLVILFSPITLPVFISKGLESIGMMTIPLSMILIGCLTANVKYKQFPKLIKNKYIWIAALTKLLFIPSLLFPFFILSVPFPLFVIATLVSGMPSAPTISLYAQKYGADTVFASFGALLTTLLCILTIPTLYYLLLIFSI